VRFDGDLVASEMGFARDQELDRRADFGEAFVETAGVTPLP
jgi:hypothetical protein